MLRCTAGLLFGRCAARGLGDRGRVSGVRGSRLAGEEALQVMRQLVGPALGGVAGRSIRLPKDGVDDQLHRWFGVFTPAEHPDAAGDS